MHVHFVCSLIGEMVDCHQQCSNPDFAAMEDLNRMKAEAMQRVHDQDSEQALGANVSLGVTLFNKGRRGAIKAQAALEGLPAQRKIETQCGCKLLDWSCAPTILHYHIPLEETFAMLCLLFLDRGRVYSLPL